MSTRSCPACPEISGQVAAPGGVIFDDGLWFVSHHAGPFTDPGELIVKTRRHCDSIAALTAAEAAALGPVLRAAVAAIERVIAPERVYVASHGERVRHVHFYLLPRTTSLPPATSPPTCTGEDAACSAGGASPPTRRLRRAWRRPPRSGPLGRRARAPLSAEPPPPTGTPGRIRWTTWTRLST